MSETTLTSGVLGTQFHKADFDYSSNKYNVKVFFVFLDKVFHSQHNFVATLLAGLNVSADCLSIWWRILFLLPG